MKSNIIRDELKHVRLIHSTLTTLSGVMLYLIIVAWSVPPQLYSELRSLEDFLRRLHTDGVSLAEIDEQSETRAEDQILESLRSLIDVRLQWEEPFHGTGLYISPIKCVQVAPSTDEQKLPLVDRLNHMTSEPCRYMLPERVEGDVRDIKAWINDTFLTTEQRPALFKELKDRVFATVSRFTLAPDSRAESGVPARVTLILTTQHVVSDKRTIEETFETKEVPLNVTLKAEAWGFPKDWLRKRYITFSAFEGALGPKTLDDALQWAKAQRTKEIESLKPTVLGVEVKGTHVGAVAPLVMVIMMLYLLAYLRHCKAVMPEKARSVKESVGFLSPWLGAQDLLGSAVTAVSIAVIPGIIITLCLRRLLGWSTVWSAMLGVIGFVIGLLVVFSGYELARRKVDDA